jgi:hypothetical protein
MAGDAEVVESDEPEHEVTGSPREVDVTIRSRVAGVEAVIGVEATSVARGVDVPWVEQKILKHQHLPTNKLVLVSEHGFSADAKKLADSYHDSSFRAIRRLEVLQN